MPGVDGARLSIYGVDGRVVRSTLIGVATAASSYNWDLRDARGVRVRPGVYLARLTRGSEAIACRVVVLD